MDAPNTAEPSNATEPRTSYLEEKAFKARTLLIFGTVTDVMAADVTRRLIALDAESPAPIDVLVSSPGGHLESGDAIHDIVRFIAAPVNMIGTGWVGSAATHLYLSVPRERRYCLPNTRFLIHQPSGGAGGPASDIAIQAREIIKARERIAVLAALNLAFELASMPAAKPASATEDGAPEAGQAQPSAEYLDTLISRLDATLSGDGHLL